MQLRVAVATALVMCCASSSAALAAEQTTHQSLETGYCRYVRGAAKSTSALMLAPELFVTTRYGQAIDDQPGATTSSNQTDLFLRLTAGISYDLFGIFRGVTTRARAVAECARYAALTRLREFLATNKDGQSAAALRARKRVLEGALPSARSILKRTRVAVDKGELRITELDATQLRVERLQAQLATVEQQLAGLPHVTPKTVAIDDLRRQREASEVRLERQEARLRQLGAWHLQVQGGYDRYFIDTRDTPAPVFAAATLSYNIGNLWQYSADADARAGRREWAQRDADDVDREITQLTRELKAAYHVGKRRLQQSSILRQDLETRVARARKLHSPDARRYADYLWFDLVQTRAECAFLAAQIDDLATALGRI